MTDTITIQWGSGHMTLLVDAFFPCELSRAQKVFKLLAGDCVNWTEDKIDELADHFREKAAEYKARSEELGRARERYQAEADKLKAGKPRRNSQAYSDWMEKRDIAYRTGVEEREALRKSQSFVKHRDTLLELTGRTA